MTDKNIIVIDPVKVSNPKAKGVYSKNGEKRNKTNIPAGINVELYSKAKIGMGTWNVSEDHV